jgi:hypothetical protein
VAVEKLETSGFELVLLLLSHRTDRPTRRAGGIDRCRGEES